MTWNIVDIHGEIQKTLTKDVGGFCVGPSPELQIAMPAVAYFENEKNIFSGTNRNVELKGAIYKLVLYRSTKENQSRGEHIRSFFPKFHRPQQTTGDLVVIDPTTEGQGDINNGDIVISRALVNPEGSDIGKEWVELSNKTERIIDLTGWKLLDRLDRPEPLEGKIEPNKAQKFIMKRQTPNSAQLGNKKGQIKLSDNQDNLIALVGYGKVQSGAILHFVSSD